MVITDKDGIADELAIIHHFCETQCGDQKIVLYAKQALIRKGKIVSKHEHPYDHFSFMHGSVLLDVDGIETMYHGTHCITVKAGKQHKVTALEDTVWFCNHASDEVDPTKIDDAILKG